MCAKKAWQASYSGEALCPNKILQEKLQQSWNQKQSTSVAMGMQVVLGVGGAGSKEVGSKWRWGTKVFDQHLWED